MVMLMEIVLPIVVGLGWTTANANVWTVFGVGDEVGFGVEVGDEVGVTLGSGGKGAGCWSGG